MKTKNNSLTIEEREERTNKIFAMVSMIGLASFLLCFILYVFKQLPIFDKIGTCGWTLCFSSFLLWQFALAAGIRKLVITGANTKWNWIAYVAGFLFFFPFIDAFFFLGINEIFNFIQNPNHSGVKMTLDQAIALSDEFNRQSKISIVIIYLSVCGVGLLWRIGKGMFKKRQLVLLGL